MHEVFLEQQEEVVDDVEYVGEGNGGVGGPRDDEGEAGKSGICEQDISLKSYSLGVHMDLQPLMVLSGSEEGRYPNAVRQNWHREEVDESMLESGEGIEESDILNSSIKEEKMNGLER